MDLPAFLLNKYTVQAFNSLYYRKQLTREKRSLVDYEPFFYPLDKILHWNRLYGREGLLQFQCVLPFEDGQHGILRILKAITNSGLASFLAVIKVFGEIKSPGMMSFPAPGITLALDFPIRREVSFDLLERLAYITVEHRGKMYPAKDARMTAMQFQAFYPQWQEFTRYIDPALSSSFWQRVSGADGECVAGGWIRRERVAGESACINPIDGLHALWYWARPRVSRWRLTGC